MITQPPGDFLVLGQSGKSAEVLGYKREVVSSTRLKSSTKRSFLRLLLPGPSQQSSLVIKGAGLWCPGTGPTDRCLLRW